MHHKYLLTSEAHDGLHTMFAIKSQRTIERNTKSIMYDGMGIVKITPSFLPSAEGVSHALNTIASAFDPCEWQDARTPRQLSYCEEQMQPPPRFKTKAEALEYKRRHTYRALWANQQLKEYAEYELDDETIPLIQTRFDYSLSLTEPTRTHLYWLATHYKMQAPTLNNGASKTSLCSAVLEAIGIHWLTPPEDYREILSDTPNHNKRRATTSFRKGLSPTKYGNPEGTPFLCDPDILRPITRELLIERGYLNPDGSYTGDGTPLPVRVPTPLPTHPQPSPLDPTTLLNTKDTPS